MKTFKKTDLLINIILIAFFILTIPFNWAIYGYFIVGAWQCISMVVHFVNKWFVEDGSARSRYHWLVVFTFLAGLSGIFIYAILWVLMLILLFAAPFMALYYTWLCYNETYVKMQRPLSLLK